MSFRWQGVTMARPATIQGPGVFLAQFIGDAPPFDSLAGLAGWAAGLGFRGVMVPTHDARILDVEAVARDGARADEVRAALADRGLVLTELAAHRFGWLLAHHPAYAVAAERMAPREVGDRVAWAGARLRLVARVCRALGVSRCAVFSGALLWPYVHPWPLRDPGLIAEGFAELARRWRPIVEAFDEAGVDLCVEPHPGCDVHDGVTFERFRAALGNHPRVKLLYDPSHMVIQGMDHLGFIDAYAPLIAAFHVKDAEFHRSARSGAFGGFQDWIDRPGRYRSPGDGAIDFRAVFSRLSQHGYGGWATLEWECCLKRAEDGAREGAAFIARHIIAVTRHDFDAALQGHRLAPGEIARALGLRP
ncbi:sugar phosphate isomerase/epimerase [Elioraea sp.]|uniref:sugar phosphate isomerase/epimerase family protein n=1 Tax=Elioraea sp. TaxID=2185103 RepID=UPI0021DE107A|nr:sugar phosphate isomerase/epimerase family protein [Elioraea sp.]GIX11704.1 MAG: AP endonuclease [Elioraea sp.]